MKAIQTVIADLGEVYNNEVTLSNGTSILVNQSIEKVEHINRIAKVISAPDYTVLKEGDEIIVHHNVFRQKRDVKGVLQDSEHLIEGTIFSVPLNLIFAYRRNGKWNALTPFCFIKPIEQQEEKIGSIIVPGSVKLGHKGYVKNRGIIRYGNDELEEWGAKEGDEVALADNSAYEFMIDGELLWRVRNQNVLGVVENLNAC